MPVHAVMAGRVMLVQHEESWGCLVCIESKLPDGSPVTHYYGHLSSEVCVYPGQIVRMGDMIGEIGPPFTLQNGGYLPHLHLGIEKNPFSKAAVRGYADNSDAWYDPVAFVKMYGGKNRCEDSRSVTLESGGGIRIRTGGDGAYQMGPRMADYWAAAAAMAGHPNESSPVNLRNIGFTVHVGGEDDAYDRDTVALQWKRQLDSLQEYDPGGIHHSTSAG
jgi:hypothetical protein